MPIQPFNSENIYAPNKGEATILPLDTDAPLKLAGLEQQRQAARLKQRELDQDALTKAFDLGSDKFYEQDTDYVMGLGRDFTNKMSKELAEGKISPQQALLKTNIFKNEWNTLKDQTLQQKAIIDGLRTTINNDKDKIYDKEGTETKLMTYIDPTTSADPIVKEQLKEVGGNVVKWRQLYGLDWAKPELKFDEVKFVNDSFKDVGYETIGEDKRVSGGTLATTRKGVNPEKLMERSTQIVNQANQGDFYAAKLVQGAENFIAKNISEDGKKITPEGFLLLKKFKDYSGYNPQNNTLQVRDADGNIQEVEVSAPEMKDLLVKTRIAQLGEATKDKEFKENLTLQNNLNINMGGQDKDVGVYGFGEKDILIGHPSVKIIDGKEVFDTEYFDVSVADGTNLPPKAFNVAKSSQLRKVSDGSENTEGGSFKAESVTNVVAPTYKGGQVGGKNAKGMMIPKSKLQDEIEKGNVEYKFLTLVKAEGTEAYGKKTEGETYYQDANEILTSGWFNTLSGATRTKAEEEYNRLREKTNALNEQLNKDKGQSTPPQPTTNKKKISGF